jgi:hypothetical protein
MGGWREEREKRDRSIFIRWWTILLASLEAVVQRKCASPFLPHMQRGNVQNSIPRKVALLIAIGIGLISSFLEVIGFLLSNLSYYVILQIIIAAPSLPILLPITILTGPLITDQEMELLSLWIIFCVNSSLAFGFILERQITPRRKQLFRLPSKE